MCSVLLNPIVFDLIRIHQVYILWNVSLNSKSKLYNSIAFNGHCDIIIRMFSDHINERVNTSSMHILVQSFKCSLFLQSNIHCDF